MHRFQVALAFGIAITGVSFDGVAVAAPTKNAIVEFVVTLRSFSDDAKQVLVEIDSVYQIRSGKAQLVERLYVDCPSNDLVDWRLLFAPGDSVLTLNRELKQTRSRGWLFWGGRGETVVIKAPQKGWTIDCRCREKQDKKSVTLFGLFDVNGQRTSAIEIEGKDRGWPGRIIPLIRGGKAEVPPRLRLICAWTEMEEDQESVALENKD